MLINCQQVKLALGEYKEAEEMYLQVKSTKIRDSFTYINHLTHCCKLIWSSGIIISSINFDILIINLRTSYDAITTIYLPPL